MLSGEKGWEWAGVGEVVAKLWGGQMANGEVLTHQSDISKNVTADVKQGRARKGEDLGVSTRYFNTLLLQASVTEARTYIISWWLE